MHHQRSNYTASYRYPAIFKALKLIAPSVRAVMSFGCAEGKECLALRQIYPEAEIRGIEIDKNRRRWAKRIRDEHIQFFSSVTKMPPMEFDLITAFAVFCRCPELNNAKSSKELYPFSGFENSLRNLDRFLKPGGFFALYNANYRFCDTTLSTRYLMVPGTTLEDPLPKFNRAGQRVSDTGDEPWLYQKLR